MSKPERWAIRRAGNVALLMAADTDTVRHVLRTFGEARPVRLFPSIPFLLTYSLLAPSFERIRILSTFVNKPEATVLTFLSINFFPGYFHRGIE